MKNLCGCRACLRERKEGEWFSENFFVPAENLMMIVCPVCGNKRCPHANDHRNACTNSNDSGQSGSAYR